MRRIALLSAALLLFTLAGTACKKKEPPPPPPPMPGQMPGQMPGGMPPGAPHGEAPAGEKKVVVPDEIKKAWKSVKVEVEFKDKKSKKQFTIPLNSDFKVPESDLTLKIGDFLPHFAMTADTITSNSNNLENPAAEAEVLIGGKTVFKGWLFAKFPAVHPFQNDKYGVVMLEATKK